MKRWLLSVVVAGALGMPLTQGCRSDDCAVGTEGCSCTTGNACDPGLMCFSQLCVSGGSANGGTGGNTNDGSATGGSIAAGGSGGTTNSTTQDALGDTSSSGAKGGTGGTASGGTGGTASGGKGGTGTGGSGGTATGGSGGTQGNVARGGACETQGQCVAGLTCSVGRCRSAANSAQACQTYGGEWNGEFCLVACETPATCPLGLERCTENTCSLP